jgi:biopolymer transport protein TolQ
LSGGTINAEQSMTGLLLNLHVAGLMFGFQESNLAGRVIVLILFVGSIFAWSVMVAKGRELRLGSRLDRAFVAAYRKEAMPVGLFLKRQQYRASPLYAIYEQTCKRLGSEYAAQGTDADDLFMGRIGVTESSLDKLSISAVRNVAERSMADQTLLQEGRMGYLATAVTTAPFLGLLGTVWGVMEAFSGMAVSGTSTLSAVAPGISGALLTTVVGLLVALPSAIGYNMLSDMIRRNCVMMDNFVQELLSDIERLYQQRE